MKVRDPVASAQVRTGSTADIVVAGEALVDLVLEPDGRYCPIPGGSPGNVAVALARLGASTQLLSRLGADTFGRLIRHHLAANHVRLDYAVDASEQTTLAVVSLDAAGQAHYNFYADGTADWGWIGGELPDQLPAGTLALVTGSLAVCREPGASALIDLINREHQRDDVSVILDPNIRPTLLGPRTAVQARWAELIGLADIVKVSDEDLAWLIPDVPAVDIAAAWVTQGPAVVVVTCGQAGAFGLTSHGITADVRPPLVDIADTVGAGDAFTAGLVDSLRLADLLGYGTRPMLADLGEKALGRLLQRATLIAAITCERRGADPPTAAQVRLRAPATGK
jgi:fructokinase